MACACKVNQQISYLQKRYGNNLPKNKQTHIKDKIEIAMKEAGLYILIIPLIPVMLLFVGIRGIFTHKAMHIDKMFKISS